MIWVDLFAVRQWPGREADMQFRNTIQRCKALIVSVPCDDDVLEYLSCKILNTDLDSERQKFLTSDAGKKAQGSVPFFRLWCNVEISHAVMVGVPVVVRAGQLYSSDTSGSSGSSARSYSMHQTNELGIMFSNINGMIDLENCACGHEEDRQREMDIIRQYSSGVQGVNTAVKGVVSGACAALTLRRFEVDSAVCGEPEALLRLNIRHGSTKVEFAHCNQILMATVCGGRINVLRDVLTRWSTPTSSSSLNINNKNWLSNLINYSNAFQFAVSLEHFEVARMLSEISDVDVNSSCHCDNSNNSPGINSLWRACEKGHARKVSFLLELPGINVNVTCLDNLPSTSGHATTPLYQAVLKSHPECVNLLLQHQEIDVMKSCNQAMPNALMLALSLDPYEAMRITFDADLSPEATKHSLHFLKERGQRRYEVLMMFRYMCRKWTRTEPGGIDPPAEGGVKTTKKRCAEGHALVSFLVPFSSSFGCDVCGAGQQRRNIMFGCEECGWDLCAKCNDE